MKSDPAARAVSVSRLLLSSDEAGSRALPGVIRALVVVTSQGKDGLTNR